jgi:hypothetical protein
LSRVIPVDRPEQQSDSDEDPENEQTLFSSMLNAISLGGGTQKSKTESKGTQTEPNIMQADSDELTLKLLYLKAVEKQGKGSRLKEKKEEKKEDKKEEEGKKEEKKKKGKKTMSFYLQSLKPAFLKGLLSRGNRLKLYLRKIA